MSVNNLPAQTIEDAQSLLSESKSKLRKVSSEVDLLAPKQKGEVHPKLVKIRKDCETGEDYVKYYKNYKGAVTILKKCMQDLDGISDQARKLASNLEKNPPKQPDVAPSTTTEPKKDESASKNQTQPSECKKGEFFVNASNPKDGVAGICAFFGKQPVDEKWKASHYCREKNPDSGLADKGGVNIAIILTTLEHNYTSHAYDQFWLDSSDDLWGAKLYPVSITRVPAHTSMFPLCIRTLFIKR
ncbi:hypothetical protein CH360_17940 [Leptospira perolatii]|nr:hypothetical protein CH360_17940 [Leptospira perolatii]